MPMSSGSQGAGSSEALKSFLKHILTRMCLYILVDFCLLSSVIVYSRLL